MSLLKKGADARKAALQLAVLGRKEKDKALQRIVAALHAKKELIFAANKKDIAFAEKNKLREALVKRLKLDNGKFKEILASVSDVKKLDDPSGKILEKMELAKGLTLEKVSVPLGVIGAVFESRPDALVQIAALALKSGNAVLMKGGSEARHTNKILADTIEKSSKISKGWLQLLETRQQVKEMLKMHQYIDLMIPRGSNAFVQYIMNNTKIPVLGHADGVCSMYVDKDASINVAVDVSYDAKVQYCAVCNAIENLLVHRSVALAFLTKMVKKYLQAGVELRLDAESYNLVTKKIMPKLNKKLIMKKIKGSHSMLHAPFGSGLIKKATAKDWQTEYTDMILSVKIVKDVNEAITFVNQYGSGHTEGIITKNEKTAEQFMNKVDASSVMWNASTRFADGFRYGKGAEVGIATSKIYARGPVGLDGLVIYKYKVRGKGHVVSSYSGKGAKKFTHKVLK